MIDFGCDFALDHTLTLSDGFSPSITNIEVDMGTQAGVFDVQMGLFTDNTFATAVNGALELNVPEPVHVQVSSDDLTVQMKRCWATPRFLN